MGVVSGGPEIGTRPLADTQKTQVEWKGSLHPAAPRGSSRSRYGLRTPMGGPEDHPAVSPPEDPVPLGTGGALVHLRLSHPRPSRSGCREGRQLVSPPSPDGRAALWARQPLLLLRPLPELVPALRVAPELDVGAKEVHAGDQGDEGHRPIEGAQAGLPGHPAAAGERGVSKGSLRAACWVE